MTDRLAEHAGRPLAEHLTAYTTHLQGKGDTPRHVSLTVARLWRALAGCGATTLADLDAAAVLAWLAGEAEHGLGQQTRVHYVRALRAFGRWLVRPGRRAAEDPFEGLPAPRVVDRRHLRRELLAAELALLLATTRASPKRFRGLAGEDRFQLYSLACGTGFRAGALAALTPESFDLGTCPRRPADVHVPTVRLSARTDKSRKGKLQPLPADVAALLGDYLPGKPAGLPVWPGGWAKHGGKGAEMLRRDLAAAGIPYVVEGPDGPLYADFHALRHTYLTLGGKAGIDLRTLQELAGHSTPTLTARYSHRRLEDLAGAVGQLPPLLPGPVPRPAIARDAPIPDDGERGTGGPGAAGARGASRVSDSWDSLPEHIRTAILALVEASRPPSGAQP